MKGIEIHKCTNGHSWQEARLNSKYPDDKVCPECQSLTVSYKLYDSSNQLVVEKFEDGSIEYNENY